MKRKTIIWSIVLNLLLLAGSVYSQPTLSFNSTLKGDEVNQWVNIGPQGGSIIDIAYNPINPDIVYCCVDGIGIFRSTDNGQSWKMALSQENVQKNLTCLAVNSKNNGVVYVAGEGVFKTNDGGATWQAMNSGLDENIWISYIELDFIHPDTIYIASNRGIFKSTNGGTEWIRMNSGLIDSSVNILAVSKSNPDVIYAGCNDAPIVYKSTDGALSWKTVLINPTGEQIRALAVDPINPDIVYAGPWGMEQINGIMKSVDGGDTWEKITVESGKDAMIIVVDPVIPNIIYLGQTTGSVFKSLDGGMNWISITEGMTSYGEVLSIAVNPKNNSGVLMGTNGDLFRSENGGLLWQESNSGINYVSIVDVALDPNNPKKIFACTVGKGLLTSSDDGVSWHNNSDMVRDHTIETIAIDPVTPNRIYCFSCYGRICKSEDNGNTWSQVFDVYAHVDSAIGTVDFASLVIDPANHNTIYAGFGSFTIPIPGYTILKSTDGGSTWHNLSSDLAFNSVTALAINPVNTSILYASTDGFGIFKTANGGISWEAKNNGLSELRVRSLAIDSNDPNILFASCWGKGVFKSEDGGESWSPINSGLGSNFINAIAIDWQNSNAVYVGTENGVYMSQDGGSTWTQLNNGLTGKGVSTIEIDPVDSHKIYAGTFNASIFRILMAPEILIGPSELSFGEVPVDSSKTLYVSLVNSSPMLNLQINKLVIGGADSADFSYTGPGAFSLVPMETRGVEVVFAPKIPGDKTAFLEIIHNGASSPDTVKLSGVAVSAVGIADFSQTHLPQQFALYPNYPNPFNPSTTIRFAVPKASQVSIRVYDILGHEVKMLVDKKYQPGKHAVIWDGRDENGQPLSNGEYLMRMQAGDFVAVRKVLLLK